MADPRTIRKQGIKVDLTVTATIPPQVKPDDAIKFVWRLLQKELRVVEKCSGLSFKFKVPESYKLKQEDE